MEQIRRISCDASQYI